MASSEGPSIYLLLQFAVRGFEGLGATAFVLPVLRSFLAAGPAEGVKPLRKNGVREVVTRKHPVGIHGAEILDLELDKRFGKGGLVTKVFGKFVYRAGLLASARTAS